MKPRRNEQEKDHEIQRLNEMTEAVQEKLHADTIDHYEEEHAERDFENADPDRRLQVVGDNRIVRRGYV